MNIQEDKYSATADRPDPAAMAARAEDVAALLGRLSNPGRLRILCALIDGPCTVTALAEQLQMPQPTVSQHLGRLREAGLVASDREGHTICNRLADDKIVTVITVLHDLYCQD